MKKVNVKVSLGIQRIRTVKNTKKFIQDQLEKLDRGIVATPASMNDLRSFARANGGNMDMLLVHQAMKYGMKLALQNIADELEK